MLFLRSFSFFFAGLFTFMLLGCNPRAVETLSLDGPDILETDQDGDFSAVANADARPPVSYFWEFGDGSTADGDSVMHAYSESGSYTVTVTATNRGGRSSVSESTSINVVNPPVPAQVLALLTSSTDIDTQTLVGFSANVRGDAPLTYNWDFGDGTSSSSPTPEHTYMSEGQYTVSLNLLNEHGQDNRTLDITVTRFEPPYCADLAEMSTVFFERNSSVLGDAALQVLGDNLEILNECLNITVRVEGLTSPWERNPQDLSEDRARAVHDHYVSNGVDEERIQTVGLGNAGGGSKKSGEDQFRRADTIPLR